jgi:hypothetical protein
VQHGTADAPDRAGRALQVHGTTEPSLTEHRHDRCAGLAHDAARAADLVLQRSRRRLRGRRRGLLQVVVDGQIGVLPVRCGGRGRDIEPARGVDPQLGDAAAQPREFLLVLEQELGAPERVFHPRTAQFVHVNSEA